MHIPTYLTYVNSINDKVKMSRLCRLFQQLIPFPLVDDRSLSRFEKLCNSGLNKLFEFESRYDSNEV